ncbi:MAG: hypothetical protein QOE08_1292 [Thermoleophilaceae bacterium]|jgi:hypothetical protein|nr:hypothetical protein [Thermoleophilaceae bacterium]
MSFAFELANGSFIFLAFLVVAFFGIVLGYFTKTGGIGEHPYDKMYGGAPGARGRSEVSGRDPRERMNWSRGTK